MRITIAIVAIFAVIANSVFAAPSNPPENNVNCNCQPGDDDCDPNAECGK